LGVRGVLPGSFRRRGPLWVPAPELRDRQSGACRCLHRLLSL